MISKIDKYLIIEWKHTQFMHIYQYNSLNLLKQLSFKNMHIKFHKTSSYTNFIWHLQFIYKFHIVYELHIQSLYTIHIHFRFKYKFHITSSYTHYTCITEKYNKLVEYPTAGVLVVVVAEKKLCYCGGDSYGA